MDKFYQAFGKMVIASTSVGFVMFFMRIVSVLIAWLGGEVLRWLFGNLLCRGLDYLFNTSRFFPSMIPAMCVVLALAGSYLVTTTNVRRD